MSTGKPRRSELATVQFSAARAMILAISAPS
jgi:hypothetical protein